MESCKFECRHYKFLECGLQISKDIKCSKRRVELFVTLLHTSLCCEYILSKKILVEILKDKCIEFKNLLPIDVDRYVDELDKILKNEIKLYKIA